MSTFRARLLAADKFLFNPSRLRAVAITWIAGYFCAICINGFSTCVATSVFPCTADFPDFALSARLALSGRGADAYNFPIFQAYVLHLFPHARDIYQFAYPPFVLLLTAWLGVLPYWAGWLVWIGGGWLTLALCLRRLLPAHWLLYSAALPAILINAVAGQNGMWTAAMVGWGLVLLPRRPILAGVILSVVTYKPQIALLLPIALVAGGLWSTLAGFLAGAVALAGSATLAYGSDIWSAFLHHNQIVRMAILENGSGIYYRMMSVFVLLHHLGVSSTTAYAVQAVMTLTVAMAVALVWRSAATRPLKNAVLVLAMGLAAPYLFDYDLAMLALVPPWLMQVEASARVRWSAVPLVLAPMMIAPITRCSGVAAGDALLLPAFGLAITLVSQSGRANLIMARNAAS